MTLLASDNFQECSSLELSEGDDFDLRIKEHLKLNRSCKSLMITIPHNRNIWLVPSTQDSLLQQIDEYSFYVPLKELPIEIFELDHLRKLELPCLGLQSINQRLENLTNLEYLDIRFNRVKINEIRESISRMNSLKILKIYGNIFDQDEIRLLEESNNNLVIYYNRQQLAEEYKTRR